MTARSFTCLSIVAAVLASAACSSSQPPAAKPRAQAAPAAAQPPSAISSEQAVAIANQLLDKLLGDLKARLTAAMEQGGPAAAIEVCATEAQHITAAVPEIAGPGVEAKVGRASLKLRNPANKAPDWVQRWLDAQGERPAEGLKAPVAVATMDGKRIARVIRPIAIQGMCLTCHGPALMIPPDVQAVLKTRYPDDQATGYALGALRGAAWAEVKVD